MKALVATADSRLVELADVPPPNGDGLTVRVEAVSVNRGELHRLYDATPGWRPGWDFAGTVTVSNSTELPIGTEVFGVSDGASWSEYVVVSHDHVAVKPSGVSWECAAALPVAGLTAMRMLRGAGNLNGRRVLVTGAAGGVGRYLVQLAVAQGAYVVAIARGERRHTAVLAERADLVITAIDELDDDEFDLVLESVGGVSLAHAMRVVAPGGVVTSFGNSSRTTTDLNVSSFYPKQANLRGFYVLADIDRNAPAEDLAALAALSVSGRLITDVALVASWSDAISVLSQLRDRHVDGKAVLRTGSLR